MTLPAIFWVTFCANRLAICVPMMTATPPRSFGCDVTISRTVASPRVRIDNRLVDPLLNLLLQQSRHRLGKSVADKFLHTHSSAEEADLAVITRSSATNSSEMFSDNWLTAVTNFGEPKASMATFSVSSLVVSADQLDLTRSHQPVSLRTFSMPASTASSTIASRFNSIHLPSTISAIFRWTCSGQRQPGQWRSTHPQASLFDLFTFLKGVNGRSILPESGARRRNRRDKEGDEKCVGKASRLAGATLEA